MVSTLLIIMILLQPLSIMDEQNPLQDSSSISSLTASTTTKDIITLEATSSLPLMKLS
ncbi:hypothetical protein DAI22_01g219900 [Oryza sativa Japonica Group]|nr:hypothetical protein DAI22_01g219900 [Oryza sativa Japonica Group]